MKKLLSIIFILILCMTFVSAKDWAAEFREYIGNINPEAEGSLGEMVNEQNGLEGFHQMGNLTDEEYDELTAELAKKAGQWMNHTLDSLDPKNESTLKILIDLQLLMDAIGNDEYFEDWGWDEEYVEDTHERIREIGDEWLKNIVDNLDPEDPSFKPWYDLLIIQQVDEIWNEKFSDLGRLYKKVHFYDKYDRWLVNRANEITTLDELEEMKLFQEVIYNDKYYDKFSKEAKEKKEEIMRRKFATFMDDAVKDDDSDPDRLKLRCERIVYGDDEKIDEEFAPFGPVCDSLDQEVIDDYKFGFFGRFWWRVRNVFDKPETVLDDEVDDLGTENWKGRLFTMSDENHFRYNQTKEGMEGHMWSFEETKFKEMKKEIGNKLKQGISTAQTEEIDEEEEGDELENFDSLAACKDGCDESGGAFKCMKNWKTGKWDCVYQELPHLTFPDGKTSCGLKATCPPAPVNCELVGFTYVKNHMVQDMWGEGKPSNKNGFVFIRSQTTKDCDEIISCTYDCVKKQDINDLYLDDDCDEMYSCQSGEEDDILIVDIDEPETGDILINEFDVELDIDTFYGVEKVKFYLDSNIEKTDISEPFKCELNPENYDNGEHILEVKVYDLVGNIVTDEITIFTETKEGAGEEVVCGDGMCMIDFETCECSDCECPAEMICDPSDPAADPMGCVPGAICGNGVCEETEYCYTCPGDCMCADTEFCAEENPGIGCAPLQ